MMLPPEPDRWTIELANAQRMEAIAAFGFSERQARFLLNVLLHSGVFVERQYCAFAGIVHGQKSTDFLKTLVERRFATPISTGKLHRGRMFHVHYKPLWAAIGEPDNRFRKPTAQGRMIERVMLLVSELATNRVGYGNLPVGASGELSMRVEPDCIRLEMRDVEATPRMDR